MLTTKQDKHTLTSLIQELLSEKKGRLGDTQIQIIEKICEGGPTTINRVKREIRKDYSYTHKTFRTLMDKRILSVVDEWGYRNRRFALYGLTQTGVLKAMQLGVAPSKVLSYADKYYPEQAIEWSIAREISYAMGEVRFLKYLKFIPEIFFTFKRNKWLITDQRLHATVAQDTSKVINVLRRHRSWMLFVRNFLRAVFKNLGFGDTLLNTIFRFSTAIGSKLLLVTRDSNYKHLEELARAKGMSIEYYLDFVVVRQHLENKGHRFFPTPEKDDLGSHL